MKKRFLVLLFLIYVICSGYTETNGGNTGIKFFDVNISSTMEDVEIFMEGISFSEKVKEKHVLEYKDVRCEGKKFNKVRYEFYNDYAKNDTSKISTIHLFIDESGIANQIERQLDKYEFISRQECYYTEGGIIKRWNVKGCVVYSFGVNSFEKMYIPRGYSPFL